MNLLHTPWIPVRLQDGSRKRIRPAEIVLQDNPPVALDAPRADFNGALAQFLIGLLQTTFAPRNDEEWEDRLEHPPMVAELDQAFARYDFAFEVDGDRPRFMQDASALEENYDERLIDGLLIEVNEVHFNKPGRIRQLCPDCAVTALFTLQINAPEGGRGHFTSLRGGGPLTTLLQMDIRKNKTATLWQHLWLNILTRSSDVTQNPEDIFPWLQPEKFIKAKTKRFVFPVDIPFEHYYWCMPRRIWLATMEPAKGNCHICNRKTEQYYTRFRTRPNGIHYANEPVWRHPLSPHAIRGKTRELIVEHPQPGGITYRHWLGYVHGGETGRETKLNAKNVARFLDLKYDDEQCIVWAFGYDMKSNKARCWYETTLPLFQVPVEYQKDFVNRVSQLIGAAEYVAGLLKSRIKEAWFKRPRDVRGDVGFLADAFYQHTEANFYTCLPQLIETIPDRDREVLRAWHQTLVRAAFELFDDWAASEDLAFADPARVALARNDLGKQLNGPKLKKILSLTQPKEKAA